MNVTDIVTAVRYNMDEIADNDAELTDDKDSSELDEIIKSKIADALLYVLQNAREDLLDSSMLSAKTGTVNDKSGAASWADVEKGDTILWTNSGTPYTSVVTTKGETFTKGTEVSTDGAASIAVPEGSVFVKIVIDASHDDATSNTVPVQLNFDYARIITARLDSWRKAVRSEDFIYEGSDDEARVTDSVSGASYQRPAVIVMFDANETVNKKKLLLVGRKSSETAYTIVYVERPGISSSTSSVTVGGKLERALINYITGLVWLTYNDKERAQEMFELALTQMGVDLTKKDN